MQTLEASNGPQDQSSTAGTFGTRFEDITAIDGLGLADNVSLSDTDTSRADLSAAEDGKGLEQPAALKKAASFKPVTFAKQKLFPVSKGVGVATGVKTAENKGECHMNRNTSRANPTSQRPSYQLIHCYACTGISTSPRRQIDQRAGKLCQELQVKW